MKWKCNKCDFEMVEIKKDTLLKIVEELNPKFLSLTSNWQSSKNDWHLICLRCDKYALGFEMEKGYPIRTKSGELTAIHELDFVKAHKHTENRKEILSSDVCGCFSCLKTFPPFKIDQWHGEGIDGIEPLAQCPYCSIDSVIGSASNFPITIEFLGKMKDFWFSPSELNKTVFDRRDK